MEELVTINQSGLPVNQVDQPVSPWIAIIQSSIEKGQDMATIEKFIDLQNKEEDRQAKRAFHKAMSRLQGSIPEISKTGRASFKLKTGGKTEYNFDSLNDIGNALRPQLQATGLSYSFRMFQNQQAITVECTVSHESGHSESNQMTAHPDNSGAKNAIQQIASTNTYLQRYTLKAAFGISSADDDGHASSATAAKKDGADKFEGWKLSLPEAVKNCPDLHSLTSFRTKSVNYAAVHGSSFCTEVYRICEEFQKTKGW